MSFGKLCYRGLPSRYAALMLITLVGSLSITAPIAHAELTWKQKAIDLRADAKSTVLEGRFPFTNTGKSAVDITQVESSCGCTVVSLEKRHYEPRETGEIVAKYTVGNQVGAQTKTVQVETKDGHSPVVLTLNIQIPEILRIQPAFVTWKHGEPLIPKTITLEMLPDAQGKDLSVQSSAVAFATEVKSLIAGRKYALSVRPLSTDQRQFSTLVIRCRFGDEEKVFHAYATVRPPDIRD